MYILLIGIGLIKIITRITKYFFNVLVFLSERNFFFQSNTKYLNKMDDNKKYSECNFN